MKKALVILGPTASGKTALALKLSTKLRCEIISLDSALVYRDMDIGTAKPTKEELAQVPHHLINIKDPKESYSAADFRKDCIDKVSEISSRGNLPIICGGTMMYYKALVEGLSPVPQTLPEIRQQVLNLASKIGWNAIHEKLRDFDEKSYIKLNPNDKQRVSRAYEVYLQTKRSISSFYEEQKGDKCPFMREEFILLPKDDDRKDLRSLIAKRFNIMLDAGLVSEVKKLYQRGDLNLNMPSMRAVGYRQVWEYLDGLYDYETMVDKAIFATSHLAKHQMTWLRGALSQSSQHKTRLLIGDPENFSKVMSVIAPFLDEYAFNS